MTHCNTRWKLQFLKTLESVGRSESLFLTAVPCLRLKSPGWCVLMGSPPSPWPGQTPRTLSGAICVVFCFRRFSTGAFVIVAQGGEKYNTPLETLSGMRASVQTPGFSRFAGVVQHRLHPCRSSAASPAAEMLRRSASSSNPNKALCRE